MRAGREVDSMCAKCSFEKVAEVEFRNLGTDLHELKDRVTRLEQMLARGVLLLVANLAAVIVTLARQLV